MDLEVYKGHVWPFLKRLVRSILNTPANTFTDEPFEEAFHYVRLTVNSGLGTQLYGDLIELIVKHCEGINFTLQNVKNDRFLTVVSETLTIYFRASIGISLRFDCLSQKYTIIRNGKNLRSELMSIFINQVLFKHQTHIIELLRKALLKPSGIKYEIMANIIKILYEITPELAKKNSILFGVFLEPCNCEHIDYSLVSHEQVQHR